MERGKKQVLAIRSMDHFRFLLGLNSDQMSAVLTHPENYFLEFQSEIKGKLRDLVDVKPPLKGALKKLNAQLQMIELPAYMQGGIKGRSCVTNALTHAGGNIVLKADIKDFFPSIGFQRVESIFRTRLHCSSRVATAAATICTYKDALPQGAPTSTMVANFVIEHLAYRLHKLAKQHGAKYSQYVDDIAISGPRHVEELKLLVARIIVEENFICHPDKLVICRAGEEHEVTGVRIDHGKDVPSKKFKAVRTAIEAIIDKEELVSEKDIRSLEGKIQHITILNRGTGNSLKKRLSRILKKTALLPGNKKKGQAHQ